MRLTLALVRFAALAGVACASLAAGTIANAQETSPSAPLNTMPKWSEFPALPTDVPTAADIKARVKAELAVQKQLDAEVAALVWDRQEPDQIHADLVSRIDLKTAAAVDPALTPAQLDAIAAALRARAAPPPIAN